MLGHEKLEVYGVALEFFALTSGTLEAIPRGHSKLKDQLDRASTSIMLNIAEGAGKRLPADKANFYTIARGSAFESAAVYDALQVRRLISDHDHEQGKWLLKRVVSMLNSMILNRVAQQ
ncbi:four helix bundle protein [Persicimonas caeni]|uniref:Four helix bundle protein n=2 Tax=Persicimonas caeni TaxID=2292766 RepID=A0A4Y6Q2Y6_PERCE|nr:four helix bundle protein [Persicimonas caeni]QED36137.1 four helix bundle protein [Persicimonas caeni]